MCRTNPANNNSRTIRAFIASPWCSTGKGSGPILTQGRDEEQARFASVVLTDPARIGPGRNSSPLPSAWRRDKRPRLNSPSRNPVVDQLPLREIRKLSPSGARPQLSTDYQTSAGRLAPAMFARWSQENFFRYMRQSYSLDSLWTIGPRLFLRRRGSSIRPMGTRWQGPQNGRQPQPQKRGIRGLEPSRPRSKPKRSRPSRSANPVSRKTSNI